MAEVLFYHLERATVERVLPELLEKTLEKGWKGLVRVGLSERLEALDSHLWTYRDDSFLPHGTARSGSPAAQPILLCEEDGNPNGADVLFLVEGAEAPDIGAFTRSVYLFDGRDEAALATARTAWTAAKDAGHEVTYWQQSETGRWERKA